MGRNDGRQLFDGKFQAWDFGPVEPTIYHRAKIFGPEPIQDVFSGALGFREDDPRRKFLDEICDAFFEYSAGDLVDITHWHEGAWAKNYVPHARNITIPNEDIIDEYRRRNAPLGS